MDTGTRRFFDLPVYRLSRERYYQQREAYINEQLRELSGSGGDETRITLDWKQEVNIRDDLARAYGGPWEYNEIIGWIQLCFVGTTVSGEYFSVRRQRIVRTRKKIIEAPTKKLGLDVRVEPRNDDSVLRSIRKYIDACKRDLSSRYIDCELFDKIAPYMNWKVLYET